MAYHPDSLDLPTQRDDGSASAPAQLGDFDNRFEHIENRETLDEAMARLPRREAEIIRLRFFEELTQSQIAQRLGISQVHVSRLLAQSLAILRSSFVDDPPKVREPAV
jgi:RNA polymerase sigma-B factor